MHFKPTMYCYAKTNFLMAAVITLVVSSISGQKTNQGSTYKKCFIGSTLFLLGNFLPNEVNPPSFVQLNFGYRLNPKNIISIEAKIWKYAWSLGIPYGKSFEALEEKFPGYISEYGLAIVYQRFFWKGLYTAVHVMNAKQTFVDNNGKK